MWRQVNVSHTTLSYSSLASSLPPRPRARKAKSDDERAGSNLKILCHGTLGKNSLTMQTSARARSILCTLSALCSAVCPYSKEALFLCLRPFVVRCTCAFAPHTLRFLICACIYVFFFYFIRFCETKNIREYKLGDQFVRARLHATRHLAAAALSHSRRARELLISPWPFNYFIVARAQRGHKIWWLFRWLNGATIKLYARINLRRCDESLRLYLTMTIFKRFFFQSDGKCWSNFI